MTVDKAIDSIGRDVKVTGGVGVVEFGIIKRVDTFGTVFVRYNGDRHNTATDADDLELC